ncbi:Os03g0176600-like protein [Zea mays]|uniref:Os03g0176600-like protein n=1 Tax=Zea mays TaxID=4577 RepID=A0A1D6JQC0_MAIZE|nr:Os03g0176600-like protein [Zea mays]
MSSSPLPTTSGGAHIFPSPPRPRHRRCSQVIVAAAAPPRSYGVGRRAVSLAGVAAWLATTVGRADAASPFDKYVKRKKLEPLETYVPAVLLTIDQFVDLAVHERSFHIWFIAEKSLEFEKPRYDESRSLLRSGPASSLRVNIRAVAQYASSNGQGKAASDAVDECLRALEDLDSLLLHASRNDPSASVETMRSKISVALAALDNLLQTVPSAVLDKGKAIADAYRTPVDDYVEG